MTSLAWQQEEHTIRASFGPLRATLDVAAPWRGFVDLCVGSHQLPGAALLGVVLPSASLPSATAPADCCVRSGELALSYRPAASSLQIDTLWRVLADDDPLTITRLDLIVSVRTEQLETEADIAVQSVLPCREMLRLAPTHAGQFALLDADSPHTLRPGDGESCLLCRLPGGELSYVEMLHPADFSLDRVQRSAQGRFSGAKIMHRLFPQRVEKGVILRARLRTALVPCHDDVQHAAALFAAFVAADPVL